MKTAKEITEYLEEDIKNWNESFQYAVYRPPNPINNAKMDALKEIRGLLLKYEYFSDNPTKLKGFEEALKWILEIENESPNS